MVIPDQRACRGRTRWCQRYLGIMERDWRARERAINGFERALFDPEQLDAAVAAAAHIKSVRWKTPATDAWLPSEDADLLDFRAYCLLAVLKLMVR